MDIIEQHVVGSKQYNLYHNNCTDVAQQIITKDTGINLHRDRSPRPDKVFKGIEEALGQQNKSVFEYLK